MDSQTDHQLLADFVETGSETAFTELVHRHTGLVHGSALRHSRDPQMAEEITQAVFLLLARKARSIRPGTVIAGWLFRATGFVSRDAIKHAMRRARRQGIRENVDMSQIPSSPEPDAEARRQLWQSLEEHLDRLLGCLSEGDRDAVLLRHLQGKSFAAVGSALGVSEEGARKRVERAIERLRQLLAREGITASSAVLGVVLEVHGVPQVPGDLAASAASAALHGKAAAGSALLAGWFGSKVAILAVGIGVLLAVSGAVRLWPESGRLPIGREILLPDGSTLRFEEPRYGGTHLFSLPPPFWRRALDWAWPIRFRPAGLQVVQGPRMQMGGDDPTLAFPAARRIPSGTPSWPTRMAVLNKEGDEFFDSMSGLASSSDVPESLEAHLLTAFPRREKEFLVGLYAGPARGAREIEILRGTVANPVYRDYPQWTPEPLPAVHSTGEVSVVFERLIPAMRLPSRRPDAMDGYHRDAVARLHFEEGGVISQRWLVAGATVEDATGNRYSTGLPDGTSEGDSILVGLRGALWPGEAAYGITLRLARRSGFNKEELLTSTQVDVPDPRETLRPEEELRNDQGTVQLVAVCGASAIRPDRWRYQQIEGRCVLCLDWRPTDEHRWMDVVEILDDHDRRVPFRAGDRNARLQCVGVDPLPDARSLRVVFALQHTMALRFQVAPEPALPKP